MKIAVMGSVTKDHIYIRSQGKEYHQAGGGVYYASMALASLGINVLAMPLLAERDATLLDSFNHPEIDVHPLWTDGTTAYKIVYPTESLDVREKSLLSSAEDHHLQDESLKELATCDAIHISPLSSGEFPTDTYARLRNIFEGLISVDAQGFVNGACVDIAPHLNGNANIIKLDDREAITLTGCNEEGGAIDVISNWNIPEILITKAGRGSTVHSEGENHAIPAYSPRCLIDATGCGDTYAAGYLVKRVQGEDPVEAAHFAARLATKVIEVKGAL